MTKGVNWFVSAVNKCVNQQTAIEYRLLHSVQWHYDKEETVLLLVGFVLADFLIVQLWRTILAQLAVSVHLMAKQLGRDSGEASKASLQLPVLQDQQGEHHALTVEQGNQTDMVAALHAEPLASPRIFQLAMRSAFQSHH